MTTPENTPKGGVAPGFLDFGLDLETQAYMDHLDHLAERDALLDHRALTENLREVLLQVVNHNGPAMLVETKDGLLQMVPLDEPQGGAE